MCKKGGVGAAGRPPLSGELLMASGRSNLKGLWGLDRFVGLLIVIVIVIVIVESVGFPRAPQGLVVVLCDPQGFKRAL